MYGCCLQDLNSSCNPKYKIGGGAQLLFLFYSDKRILHPYKNEKSKTIPIAPISHTISIMER